MRLKNKNFAKIKENPKKNEKENGLSSIPLFSKKSLLEKQGENRVIFQSSLLGDLTRGVDR